MMKYLHLQPHDPLFFRDGKPFTMGDDVWLKSSNIPSPSVVWGAMFTTLLAYNKVKPEETDKLLINNIYLYDQKNKIVLVPAPLDIFVGDNNEAISQKFVSADTFIHESKLVDYFISPLIDEELDNAEGYYIKLTDLIRHYPYKDAYSYITFYDSSSFGQPYNKLGIKRNKVTNTTDNEALYHIEMIEYSEDWGFVVEYESKEEFPTKGFLRLGGEGKTVSYRNINQPYDIEIFNNNSSLSNDSDTCKVYIQSPTFISDDLFEKLNVDSAYIGKPVTIGGFDVKEKKPKSMLRAIPAGSILVLGSDIKQSVSQWTNIIGQVLRNSPQNQNLQVMNTNGFGSFQIIPINEFNF